MTPTQPVLVPCTGSPTPTISSLSLSQTPPSPAPSELSLLDDEDRSGSSSVAATSATCCDETCCPSGEPSSSSSLPPFALDEAAFLPLVIIGAGPHGLALAARLSEPRPAALYTDLEHARLSWLQREGNSQRRRATVKGHWAARKLVEPEETTLAPPDAKKPALAVLDSTSASWMGRWNGFFSGLGIKHLRSPMLFHPSPADADALVAYAKRMDREDELEPVKGVVGREFSKYQRKKHPGRIGRAVAVNERSREDYYRPSTPLFRSFIRSDLIDRYSVAPLVTHTAVTSLTYRPLHIRGRGVEQGFLVESRRPDGTVEFRGARAVTIAIGPSSKPNIPPVLAAALPRLPDMRRPEETGSPWEKSEICGEGWCHSAAFALEGCRPMDEELGAKVRRGERTRVVVVGGGLTSAQIVDSLLSSGVSHVTLLSRSHIKTKHFDFDLPWVSKYANTEKMAFWQAEDRLERWEIIQRARNGGSVNPTFLHILQKHAKAGRLDLRTLTEVRHASYDGEEKKWRFEVATKPDAKATAKAEAAGAEPAKETLSTIEGVDYLVCSTGSKHDLAQVPFLQPMLKSHPVELVNGLPVLTADLQWNDELPLFVMGAYSMLELGPDALNLSGTRAGAERVAHRLGELGVFDDVDGGGVQRVEREKSRRMREKESRSGGIDNYFAGLGEVEA
ncbi:hypothetical protein JCM10213_002021 [Rhodosporidiobolus nylandii]